MAVARVRIERVLCPTDFSEFAERALKRAVGLARWFEARVTVLHVIPHIPRSAAITSRGIYVPVPTDILRAQREAAEKELQRLVESMIGEGVPIDGKLLQGDPARTIQAIAETLPAQLVVMGTQFFGSTANQVVRHATCPVLTVRETRPASSGAEETAVLSAAQ